MHVHLLQTGGFVEHHVAVRQCLDAVEPAEEPRLVQAERATRRTLAPNDRSSSVTVCDRASRNSRYSANA